LSRVDGFAVRSSDTTLAGPERPVRLRVGGLLRAGEATPASLGPGMALAIATGAALPIGADAVIPWEEVHTLPRDTDLRSAREVLVPRAATPGEHVLQPGEEACQGEVLLRPGDVVDLTALDALLAQGVASIPVQRTPRVGILPTGSELVPWDAPKAAPYQVRCSNAVLLAQLVHRAGGTPVPFPPVPDDLGALRAAIVQAAGESSLDLLITTGGASRGPFDFTVAAVADLGEVLFADLAVSPGRGTAFGLVQGVPVLCLPGGALSARILFEVLARPAVLRLGGRRHVLRERFRVHLTEDVQARPGTTRLMPACLHWTEDGWLAQPRRARVFRCPGQWEGLLFVQEGSDPVAEVWEAPETVPFP
ncbi:MAG: molybdopterin molybdotransferase MoeA, partial [Anaerolineae bacterium]